jgi:hypothetical protein
MCTERYAIGKKYRRRKTNEARHMDDKTGGTGDIYGFNIFVRGM